ncbi:PP2C family protein-serine/threonine phosphatase [Kitasatospora sp. A2-31]|uniref:PP2C family protein-serine/threonine phosphatase n=1 Tax=Kitasatospora sp. A2-31 TaxID=2916414 RepID=UPI001EEA9388|nr:SpoIIE family protein phosphatase [Kitasatospora sp. A2-31]MCG6494305.1 SpoIIE family protein phosphatase [Kitasatospora sp. A2-31]
MFTSSRYLSRRPPREGDGEAGGLPVPAVQEVLDALPGSVIFLLPVRTAGGEVADFRIAAASPDAVDIGGRRGRHLIGVSVLETYPTVAGSELWHGYLKALTTGDRYEGESFEYEEVLAGIPRLSRFAVRAAPCQQGLIVSWVRLDSGERERRRLTVMQRLGNMGWADWDLVHDVITWSDQVYAVFGRDRSLGPMTLEELPTHVLAEDLPALGETVQHLLADGEPVDHTFRITSPDGGVRHVRIVAEAETDARGQPVEVHGFFQDLTAAKSAEQRLLERERTVLAQRTLLASERRLAARLQHALLPLSQQSLRLADLTVDVAYRPQQEGLEVGGDWYSAVELPDGSVLLVIGDVAGHGLDAVATMAQLRFSAKGMAITAGIPPETILAQLNTLLLHTTQRVLTTATMIVARYDPATSELTWARAGHPAPLLLRGGRARYLPLPPGILLGATDAPRYESASLRLLPGDHLLLYTDGLIEERGRTIDHGLARLAAAAEARADDARILDGILDTLVGSGGRHDDICVLHVRR